MSKYIPKTTATDASVDEFIASADPKKRDDSLKLMKMMRDVSGQEPKMWGPTMIGFGRYHYVSKGCEGDWFKIGFSPRKAAFSIYISCDADEFSDELDRLGKHKRGKGCIYINKLADIDFDVLTDMTRQAYQNSRDYETK